MDKKALQRFTNKHEVKTNYELWQVIKEIDQKQDASDTAFWEEKIQWITRTLIGAIITGIVTLLIAYLKFVIKI